MWLCGYVAMWLSGYVAKWSPCPSTYRLPPHPPTHPLTPPTHPHPAPPFVSIHIPTRTMFSPHHVWAKAFLFSSQGHERRRLRQAMGGDRKRKDQEARDKPPSPSSDSEDELVWRIQRLQCTEAHHYMCDLCSQHYTGNHSFHWHWNADKCVWESHCAKCQEQHEEDYNKGKNDTSGSDKGKNKGETESRPCASDHACAATCSTAEWLGQEPQDIPVPDEEVDEADLDPDKDDQQKDNADSDQQGQSKKP